MQIIPAINEKSFSEIEEKIIKADSFGAEWVHLDVSDGEFTENELWNDAFNLRDFIIANKHLSAKFEVHLMVNNPEEIVSDWIDAGAKRVTVHLEAIKDLKLIKDKCSLFDIELFLAGNSDTPVEKFIEYKDSVNGFLILAVKPGRAGQKFGDNQLEKIKLLRVQAPNVKIIVDGGVNLDNASQIKNAGADILVAASAIWGSADPKAAYDKFKSI